MPDHLWTAAFASVWVLVLAQSVVLIALSRRVHALSQAGGPDAVDVGPELAAQIPEALATDIAGETVAIGGPASERRLLIFLSTTCSACRLAVSEVARLRPGDTRIVLVWNASRAALETLVEEHQIRMSVIADEERSFWKMLNITVVPFAVALNEEGRVIGKSFAHRVEQLEELLVGPDGRDSEKAPGVHVAVPAP